MRPVAKPDAAITFPHRYSNTGTSSNGSCPRSIRILAIIFGGVAINQTGKNPNLSGRGMAIAGLILGIVGFFITLFVIIAIVGAAATIF
jgi:hypothetical protein